MSLRSSKTQLNLQEFGDHVSLSTLEPGDQAQVEGSALGEPVSRAPQGWRMVSILSGLWGPDTGETVKK